jgi:4-hydroxy-tetrahydrodipicolinate reductase
LVSPDETVAFKFEHNINGRDVYADGTFDAVVFLARKIAQGSRARVFSMIEVLKGA